MRSVETSPTMNAEALAALLEQGEPVLVLDVRPDAQHKEWYIPGSIHIDAYEALRRNDPQALAGLDLPDDRLIVTVCGAGKTSLIAAEQLRRQGRRAVSLEQGMKAWSLASNTADVPLAATSVRVVQVRRTGKGCLSYLTESEGQAAVVDAALPPQRYIQLARERGWEITHVLDTHIHADHLSRSRMLAEETGARLFLPEQQRAAFSFEPLRDGDLLQIGGVRLQAVHTPGHTPESTSFLLDEAVLFTGDTLFAEGVGRPDLEATPAEARNRARALYRSLHRLLQRVAGDTLVLPGHTSEPVAFDGQVIGDTLRSIQQRIDLLELSEDAFIERLLGRIPPTPPNHEHIVRLNEAGAWPPAEILDLEAGANRCAVS